MRLLIAAMMAAALFAQSAYAQRSGPPSGPTDQQKVDALTKRNFTKDTDEAYKATMDKIPDKKAADPWGSLRAPAQPGGK